MEIRSSRLSRVHNKLLKPEVFLRPVFLTLQADQGLVIPPATRVEVARGGRRLIRLPSYVLRVAARGDVAQLGEHLLCKQGVGGSSPLISTSTLTTE